MKLQLTFANEHEQANLFVRKNKADVMELLQDGVYHLVLKEMEAEEQTLEKVRFQAGNAAKKARQYEPEQVMINENQLVEAFSTLDKAEVITAFTEGWLLGGYVFDTYKSKKQKSLPRLHWQTEAAWQKAISKGEIRAAATALSRDLMNDISSHLNPETFPGILEQAMAGTNTNVIVHQKAELEGMQMNGILTVNRGSKYDPAMIELHYEGDKTKPLIALVGKGVTFDTGGISLKSGRDISDMRMDMGGAAAVAGAIQLLAASNAPVNVVGIIQTVENMPGKDAVLPGEVITYKNGHTVQIGNTDAEGRLILADGLIRAGELDAAYIVDIATLTGSIERALGHEMAGVFGDESLADKMKTIGEVNGDRVWPMPLIEAYDQTLKSDYADFSNISTMGPAGAITAALFLRRFVPKNSKWLHVDMAGVMEKKAEGYYTDAASGYGARLLADYAEAISK